jgi:hypothetical protein
MCAYPLLPPTITINGAVRTRLLAVAFYLLSPTLVACARNPSSFLNRRIWSGGGFGVVLSCRRCTARRSLRCLVNVGALPLCGLRIVELVRGSLNVIHSRSRRSQTQSEQGAAARNVDHERRRPKADHVDRSDAAWFVAQLRISLPDTGTVPFGLGFSQKGDRRTADGTVSRAVFDAQTRFSNTMMLTADG